LPHFSHCYCRFGFQSRTLTTIVLGEKLFRLKLFRLKNYLG
jgi:hypothetical protein